MLTLVDPRFDRESRGLKHARGVGCRVKEKHQHSPPYRGTLHCPILWSVPKLNSGRLLLTVSIDLVVEAKPAQEKVRATRVMEVERAAQDVVGRAAVLDGPSDLLHQRIAPSDLAGSPSTSRSGRSSSDISRALATRRSPVRHSYDQSPSSHSASSRY